jgi:hypothetical protein
VHLGLRIRGVS